MAARSDIRITLLAMAFGAGLSISAQDVVQTAFLNATDPTGIQRLHALTQRMEPNVPRTTAYQGAATAMLAEVDASVWAKWKHCRDGMRLLDQAVELAPRDAEIRFLRFVVADATPGFLGFRTNVTADAEVVIQAMERHTSGPQDLFWQHALNALAKSTSLDPAQKERLQNVPNR